MNSYRPISLFSLKQTDPRNTVQNTTLYNDGTTHIKKHHSKGVQPNDSPARKQKLPMELIQMAKMELFGPSCVHSNRRLRTRYLIIAPL